MSTKRQIPQGATMTDPPPPDLAVMRETTQIVLAFDSGPYPLLRDDELTALTDTLRRHIEVLAPEVEQAARRLPENAVTRHGALCCVSEARGKLRAPQVAFPPQAGTAMYARRLARVLVALCDHYETVSTGVVETPEQAAFVRLADHCLKCPTCRAMDDEGANLGLPCETHDRLYDEYREAWERARIGHRRPAEASA
ncbi:DUF6415 family natural product biosynthesis protein [Streptomyces lomondensis]|uniref:MarR family transcriptional regulator n=1 Tax=Streptomyces lomondensis TaxID=68229 RepID=A0ABQ2XU34_9ACTN|nr:DUF6415 family natural product biosynthesis protein [Streptomyces lomondensis]MCF0082441.1 DUF6415 family natural product biosynthesis protein [Streptomyces lomondensis]GGX33691.1 hypothetical protein GCM10010383_75010 [Streptomyces lomondensis]